MSHLSPVPVVADPNDLNEITKYCEKIISQTQADLDLFRHDQIQLREQILNILEENNRLNTKLEFLKNTATATDSRDDATREKLANDALKNVKKQMDNLQAENHDLRSLNQSSQRTIRNLESEVQNYRNQLLGTKSLGQIKHKYSTAMKLLESTIKKQKTDLVKQAEIIENLLDEKKQYSEHIETMEATLKEKELVYSNHDNTMQSLNEQLQESKRQAKELDKSLKLSQRISEGRFDREKCSLQKVEEALAIAEDAVKRERVLKEECDNLAATIGQVMDEAARKVDKDMESLHKKFAGKEQVLLETQEKLQDEIQNQRKSYQIMETRCHCSEQKCKETAKGNAQLSQELQVAIKLLDEMQLKLQANENLRQQGKNAQRRADELKQKVQYYIQTNKQLKEKCLATLDDVTKKFENEIHHLQNENAYLKAENQVIKLQQA